MSEVNEAYVLGLLTDIDRELPRTYAALSQQQRQAAAIDAELGQLLVRVDESQAAWDQAKSRREKLAGEIAETNHRAATLHQEIAALTRRADLLTQEMAQAGRNDPAYLKLRRERAKQRVQIERREKNLSEVEQTLGSLRTEHRQADTATIAERERTEALGVELEGLQAQLPDPARVVHVFELQLAQAHCRFVLDGDIDVWRQEVEAALEVIEALHRDLRAGKYPLDRNSDLIGGRATATVEALYGAVAIGQPERALELFRVACDPSLFFHSIFNVFRVWCLGLYLAGQVSELRELLRYHQYSHGPRGVYVRLFTALLEGDAEGLQKAWGAALKFGSAFWRQVSRVQGLGVVNTTVLATARLARSRGLGLPAPSVTSPRSALEAQ